MIETKTFKFGEVGKNNLLITTGLHGNEIAPLFLGNELIELLKSKEIGDYFGFDSITIINGVNLTGIIKNERDYSDLIGKDLNRSFDNNKSFDEIKKLLARYKGNHFLIDIHTSPNCCDFFLYNVKKEMPDHFIGCIKNDIPYALWENEKSTFKNYFEDYGITYEISGMSNTPSKNALLILLDFIQMLNSNDKSPISLVIKEVSTMKYILALYSGLIKWHKNKGEKVDIGDTIIDLIDFSGKKIHSVNSPIKGRLIDLADKSFVNAGEEIFGIQPEIYL